MVSVADLAEARLPWLSPRLLEWWPTARLHAQLQSGLSAEVARVADVSFGSEFRDAVGLPVTDPLAWANRRLDVAGGGWVVTGIRFRGGDVLRPFVDVVATTAAPGPDGLDLLADTLLEAYQDFSPLSIRVAVGDPSALVRDVDADSRFGTGSSVDQYVVAGRVADLLGRPGRSAYDAVTLRAGAPDALAAKVSEHYRRLTEANPQLALWATPEDEASLACCAAQGLLFEVCVDGDAIGVVAASREDAHGMSGFCVEEIVIDPDHQGRGLAPGALQRLIDVLPDGGEDVLWGSIHPDNEPSLRNALSIGREIVGGWAWISLSGMAGMPTGVAIAPG